MPWESPLSNQPTQSQKPPQAVHPPGSRDTQGSSKWPLKAEKGATRGRGHTLEQVGMVCEGDDTLSAVRQKWSKAGKACPPERQQPRQRPRELQLPQQSLEDRHR